jgi:hypothetical protein
MRAGLLPRLLPRPGPTRASTESHHLDALELELGDEPTR